MQVILRIGYTTYVGHMSGTAVDSINAILSNFREIDQVRIVDDKASDGWRYAEVQTTKKLPFSMIVQSERVLHPDDDTFTLWKKED